jgi:hypothetical protein
MPRERVCVLHFVCEVWRGGDHVSRGSGSAALWLAGNSRCVDFHRVRDRIATYSIRCRNARADSTGLGAPVISEESLARFRGWKRRAIEWYALPESGDRSLLEKLEFVARSPDFPSRLRRLSEVQ